MTPLYWLGHRFFREVARGFFGLRVVGAENAGFEGPALITSNHESFLDPPFIGAAFEEDICYLARKTLFRFAISNFLLTHWQAIPVDQDKPDPGSMKTIFRRLKQGKKVIVFPEGNRAPDGLLQKGEPGIGLLIAKAGVPILPVRIFGAFEALPRHRAFPRPHQITVTFGRPWTYDPADFRSKGKDLYQEISDTVMQRIADLHE